MTRQPFAYLCVVIDLFARKVSSFRLGYKMNAAFVVETVKDAVVKRRSLDSVIFHSDRGTQYTSQEFRVYLDQLDFTQSFSKPGHPWDNAVVESFFKFLKLEELNRNTFQNLHELKLAVFEYIEGFYNSKRPHSANNMLTPNEKEKLFFANFHD